MFKDYIKLKRASTELNEDPLAVEIIRKQNRIRNNSANVITKGTYFFGKETDNYDRTTPMFIT